jgi:hypothetical protein
MARVEQEEKEKQKRIERFLRGSAYVLKGRGFKQRRQMAKYSGDLSPEGYE